MDNPIAALDKNVLAKIFDGLLSNYLADKTRIMVTHSVEYLHHFDRIMLLKRGRVVAAGAPEEL